MSPGFGDFQSPPHPALCCPLGCIGWFSLRGRFKHVSSVFYFTCTLACGLAVGPFDGLMVLQLPILVKGFVSGCQAWRHPAFFKQAP